MLPKHILKAAENNQTSIGDNQCLPPEEETKYIVSILSEYFDSISSKVDINNSDALKQELNNCIIKAKEIEKENKTNLERLCIECVTELFNIPEETLDINVSLVDSIDSSNQRLFPEKVIDFSFEDITDLSNLTKEIYKRRFLNSLIAGASLYYTNKFDLYFHKIFNINPELPALYKKILNLNELLIYLSKDSINTENSNDGGKVDVIMNSKQNIVQINTEALLFPILLSETIKGILELAIAHGLPKSREKAQYVISKSDFKFAELWDIRLGVPLWNQIIKLSETEGKDITTVGINFILMKLAMLPVDEFNDVMKEILANTNKGKNLFFSLLNEITTEKDRCDFDDYMTTQQNSEPIITDNNYFNDDELLVDDEYFNAEELLSEYTE